MLQDQQVYLENSMMVFFLRQLCLEAILHWKIYQYHLNQLISYHLHQAIASSPLLKPIWEEETLFSTLAAEEVFTQQFFFLQITLIVFLLSSMLAVDLDSSALLFALSHTASSSASSHANEVKSSLLKSKLALLLGQLLYFCIFLSVLRHWYQITLVQVKHHSPLREL